MAAAGAIAPIIGGVLSDVFALRELMFSITFTDPGGAIVIHTYHLAGLDFLFVISVVFGVFALHRLSLVKEVGEVDERVVLEAIAAETRRNVKTISTVDGLRSTFQVPIETTRRISKSRKSRTPRKKTIPKSTEKADTESTSTSKEQDSI
jgi:hypothetical protein